MTCALDEWEDGQRRNVSFSADRYRPVYLSIVQLVEEVNGDDYHKNKFARARALWARHGRFVLSTTLSADDKFISLLFRLQGDSAEADEFTSRGFAVRID